MVKIEVLNKNDVSLEVRNQVVLSTCNRAEVYSGDGEIPKEVIRHLFRVTSGLESSLIGEKAIQGQVKEAYSRAAALGLTSSLHKLFQRALNVGKKVRTVTGINKGAVSHSQAAVDLLLKLDLNISDSFITIIGANHLNDKIIYYLNRKGAKTVFIGNRTYEKAEKIAERHKSEVFHLNDLHSVLERSDIIITATSAPHTIIHKEHIPTDREITIIDLAVPADTGEEVINMENITYYNNAGVEETVNLNLDTRRLEIEKAAVIVDQEVEKFIAKLRNDRERTYGQYKNSFAG